MIPCIPFPQKALNKYPPPKKKNKSIRTSGQHDSPNDKALYKQIENETLNHWLTNHKECGNVHWPKMAKVMFCLKFSKYNNKQMKINLETNISQFY